MADEEKQIKKKENEPAPWKPIDLEKFNKNTKDVSKVFKLDPERVNEAQNNNSNIEK